jgi:hypothetical protein
MPMQGTTRKLADEAPARTSPPTPRPSAARLLRKHWLLALLLTAGLALRVLAQIAYRPALLYIDSIKYLYGAYPGVDPSGYLIAVRPFLETGRLDLVAAIQHLLGLAMAVALYLLMRRRGVPRWLAALGTGPILLDAYQLQNEQTIMPDTLFEALIVTGLVILLWRSHPRLWMIVGAGLAIGASASVREIGGILVLPAVCYLFTAIPGWRAKLSAGLALSVACTLPILAVSFRDYLAFKRFALAPYAQSTIYGRAAAVADCAALRLPGYERPLCPTRKEQALGPDQLDHGTLSPIKSYVAPPGMHTSQIASDFSSRVFAQQPLRILRGTARDAVKLFAVHRVSDPGDTPLSRWQFRTTYPSYPPYITMRAGRLRFAQLTAAGRLKILGRGQPQAAGRPAVIRPVAAFLRDYQLGGGYTPGPLFLLAAVAGLLGSLGLLRRRGTQSRQTAVTCLVMLMAGSSVLVGADVFEFSWRYQLPALVTVVPAGALGITVVTGWFTAHRGRPTGQPAFAPLARQAPEFSGGRPGLQAKDRASAG